MVLTATSSDSPSVLESVISRMRAHTTLHTVCSVQRPSNRRFFHEGRTACGGRRDRDHAHVKGQQQPGVHHAASALLAGLAVAVVAVNAKLGAPGRHSDYSDAQSWAVTTACVLAAVGLARLGLGISRTSDGAQSAKPTR